MWIPILCSITIILYGGRWYGWVKFGITGNYNDRYNVRRKHRDDQSAIETLLHEKYRYYRNLSPKAKNKFLARLCKVLEQSEFAGHHGLEITDEMKVCVLFSKIQLTFGLRRFHFKRFKKFILYPESFYSRYFESYLKGLTSGAGFVSFSWHDFQEGYLVHNDKFNLGLHEMAHALRLELQHTEYPGWKTIYLNGKMDQKALEEMKLAERDVPNILREYAFTSKEEFFSVCVEYFFEVPELLKAHKPEIFDTLSGMLNQNPMHIHSDYSLSAEM
ncbi:MAG: zinc-dependent peptidase [Bacteroidia bacterium]|jgi:hypothetical protein